MPLGLACATLSTFSGFRTSSGVQMLLLGSFISTDKKRYERALLSKSFRMLGTAPPRGGSVAIVSALSAI